jgi:hypothetical protein
MQLKFETSEASKERCVLSSENESRTLSMGIGAPDGERHAPVNPPTLCIDYKEQDPFDALQELLGAMQDELALREWPEVWGERCRRAADFRRALYAAIAAYRDEWCER